MKSITLAAGLALVLVAPQAGFAQSSASAHSAVTVPSRTQNINIATGSEEGTAKGVNVGVDGTYLFTPRVGAGIFLRYAGGSVDLPSAPGLKVGGFQAGIGARIRF